MHEWAWTISCTGSISCMLPVRVSYWLPSLARFSANCHATLLDAAAADALARTVAGVVRSDCDVMDRAC